MLKHFHWVFFTPLHFQMCEGRGACVHGSLCVCLLKLWSYQPLPRLLPRRGQISCCVDAAKERFRLRRFLSSSGSSAETQLLHSGPTLYWLWQGHCTRISPRMHERESWACVCVESEGERERVCALHPPKANYVSQAPLNSSNIFFLCITKQPIHRHESNPSVNVH